MYNLVITVKINLMSKKNLLHLLAIMMVAMLSVGFASCGDNDDDEIVPQGEHSMDTETDNVITMQVGVYQSINIFTSIVYGNGCFSFSDGRSGSESGYNEIACVGKVTGLSSIKSIPGAEEWSRVAIVEKGCGYVIRCHRVLNNYGVDHGYVYHRLFVVDFVKDSSGGILAVKAKYEELKI